MKKTSSSININGFSVPKEIFTRKFAPCDLSACRHACCQHACMMGEIRINKITRLLPKLYPLMREEAVRVVKKKGFSVGTAFKRFDMDPTHKHYYCRTVSNRCVFLSYNDKGGCVLQKYCKTHNMKYQLKPEGCWGFPFDLIGKRLAIYKWKNLPCLNNKSRKAPPIYKTCKMELKGFLGEEGYKELLRSAPRV